MVTAFRPHDVEYSDCVCASIVQFDMLLPEQKEYAAKLLVDNIKSYNNHITTGF